MILSSAFFRKRGRRSFLIPTLPSSRLRTVAIAHFSPTPMATMAAGQSGASWNFCASSDHRPRLSGRAKLESAPIQSPSRMKLGAKIVLATVLVFSLTFVLHAEPISQLSPTDYVNDFAHVLDQNTIAQLDSICQQIDEKAHAQIAVVTIKSLDG